MAGNELFEKYGMTVDAGKVLFREDEQGEHMYIIQDGSVRISKTMDGKEHTLAVLGKGDFFGEMAIVNQTKRTATATAACTVKLLKFDRTGFLRMIEMNSKMALGVIDKLCRRLQQANLQIQHLVRQNVKGLVALNLHYAYSEQGENTTSLEYPRILRDFSLNMTVPQDRIRRAIDELREKEIVKLEDDQLVLIDPGRLADLAETAGN
jgi:CRP-like cAMP-binding protein